MQDLITRFYAVRGMVRVDDPEAVRAGVRGLLTTVGTVLDDQEAVHRLDTAGAEAEAALDALGEARRCLLGMETLALGPAFDDTVTVLYIVCEQLGVEAQAAGGGPLAEDVVLGKIDDLLTLFGLGEQAVVRKARKKSLSHRHVKKTDGGLSKKSCRCVPCGGMRSAS